MKNNEEVLAELKIELADKLGITDSKELKILECDLKDALSDVLDYTNRDELIGNMDRSVKDMMIVRYNQEGNEGESSRSEGGVSQSFEIGIPLKIKMKLDRYVIGKVISFYET